MASLSTIWAVGLSVLGVYIFKRSEDKKIFSGFSSMVTPSVELPDLPVPSRKPQARAAQKEMHINA
jgi:hypothetical protein